MVPSVVHRWLAPGAGLDDTARMTGLVGAVSVVMFVAGPAIAVEEAHLVGGTHEEQATLQWLLIGAVHLQMWCGLAATIVSWMRGGRVPRRRHVVSTLAVMASAVAGNGVALAAGSAWWTVATLAAAHMTAGLLVLYQSTLGDQVARLFASRHGEFHGARASVMAATAVLATLVLALLRPFGLVWVLPAMIVLIGLVALLTARWSAYPSTQSLETTETGTTQLGYWRERQFWQGLAAFFVAQGLAALGSVALAISLQALGYGALILTGVVLGRLVVLSVARHGGRLADQAGGSRLAVRVFVIAGVGGAATVIPAVVVAAPRPVVLPTVGVLTAVLAWCWVVVERRLVEPRWRWSYRVVAASLGVLGAVLVANDRLGPALALLAGLGFIVGTAASNVAIPLSKAVITMRWSGRPIIVMGWAGTIGGALAGTAGGSQLTTVMVIAALLALLGVGAVRSDVR